MQGGDGKNLTLALSIEILCQFWFTCLASGSGPSRGFDDMETGINTFRISTGRQNKCLPTKACINSFITPVNYSTKACSNDFI